MCLYRCCLFFIENGEIILKTGNAAFFPHWKSKRLRKRSYVLEIHNTSVFPASCHPVFLCSAGDKTLTMLVDGSSMPELCPQPAEKFCCKISFFSTFSLLAQQNLFLRCGSCRIQVSVISASEVNFLKLYLVKVVQSSVSRVVQAVSSFRRHW